MKKRLEREVQCTKCPWKKSTNPYNIPNGYCKEKHRKLEGTIARDLILSNHLRVMACHEEDNAYCIGWLMNQLGSGNNIGLRLKMMKYDLSKVKLIGEQHEKFEDTLPD